MLKSDFTNAMLWLVNHTKANTTSDELRVILFNAPDQVIKYLAANRGQNEFVVFYTTVAQEILAERILLNGFSEIESGTIISD